MRKVRGVQLAVFVTLAGAVAAQDAGTPMAQPPALPATAEENWIVKRFKMERAMTLNCKGTARGVVSEKADPCKIREGVREDT
jgi:hypothetical protein